jgi:hypothetical protein
MLEVDFSELIADFRLMLRDSILGSISENRMRHVLIEFFKNERSCEWLKQKYNEEVRWGNALIIKFRDQNF